MTRILVIEDDIHVRDVLRKILVRAGYEVVEARDGNEGLKRYHETKTDLIITDIIMPEKDGIETIAELKTENPDVKIIAISGGGTFGPKPYLQVAEGFGASRLIRKPFKAEDLLGTVEDVLNN